jgi:type III secretion system low calcium response chaperone LcrH/SycD
MPNQLKEIIEQAIEKSGCQVPENFKPQMVETFLKIYEGNATPKEALKISDEIMETIYNYSYTLYKSGKYKQAVRIFEVLRKLNLADIRYSFATAVCYHYMKDYTNAAANYIICRELNPFDPIPSFHLYDCYMKLNNPILATRALAEVIVKSEFDPRYSQLKERALLEKENLTANIQNYIEEHKEEFQSKLKK